MHILISLFFLLSISNSVFSQGEEEAESAFSDGMFNLIIGRAELAEENFTQAIADKDRVPKAYYFRSKARSGYGNFEGALDDINESLKLEPEDNSSLDMRAKLYLAMDRPEEALTDFEKVYAADPEFEEILLSLGRTYYKLKRYETAIAKFDEAIIEDSDDETSYRLRGMCYLLLKMDEKGCNDLSRARKLGENGLDDIINEYCGDVEILEENQNSEYDWNFYDLADEIDTDNASIYTSFSKDDPESMVNYFYASRIRGDEKWKAVLQPESEWSDRLKHSLARYDKWDFVRFHLVKKKRHSEIGWWFGAYFEIEVNGKKDGGNDEISLEFQNSEWMITGLPN